MAAAKLKSQGLKVSAEFGLAQAGQGELQASPGGGFKSLLYGGLCRLLSRTAWL